MTVFLSGRYFVYLLIDPRNNDVFYIGESQYPEDRALGHHMDSLRRTPSNAAKAAQINAIHKSGNKVILKVIAAHRTRQSAIIHEASLVSFLSAQPWRADELFREIPAHTGHKLTNAAARSIKASNRRA